MKKIKNLFAAATLCAALATTFCACSEKEETPSTPAAKSVEGVYNGDMTCTVMGSDTVFEDVTFTLTAADEAAVDIAISSFGEPPMQVSSITVRGVAVSGTDSACTLAVTQFEGTTDDGKVYSGTVRGTFADGVILIDLSLQYGAMPMPLICKFSAPRR